MRVLITSNDHPSYNQTGEIVEDLGQEGVKVKLDASGQVTSVNEGQWKVIKDTKEHSQAEVTAYAEAATYGAAEGIFSVLGQIIN
jgi:hypothetical protein